MESGHGDLGTLANVVTSLANLSDSLKETLNNGDTSDSQQEEQNTNEITRSVSRVICLKAMRGTDSHLSLFYFPERAISKGSIKSSLSLINNTIQFPPEDTCSSYMYLNLCVVHSAFDTLAKVLHPPELGVRQSVSDKSQCVSGTTIQLIGRDQETPIIEVEGPLLTDSHVSFKVGGDPVQ